MHVEAVRSAHRDRFAHDVREGLLAEGQKTLPCEYLYDELGSSLFDAICRLPEYGLSRAGERLMRASRDALAGALSGARIAELGSGSGGKTRCLLEAFAAHGRLDYHPIDVSEAALDACSDSLARLEGVTVHPFCGTYLHGLAHASGERAPGERLLVLFLGSTIGNFDKDAAMSFLRDLRRGLSRGDGLLIAFDLEKPAEQLIDAYDDPLGVTAAFNLNLLARINRELGGTFDLGRFAHEARYDAERRRIEMHLRSSCNQRVQVPGADLEVRFRAGETIWTESSHKFVPSEVDALAAAARFRPEETWIDREWPFTHRLWIAA